MVCKQVPGASVNRVFWSIVGHSLCHSYTRCSSSLSHLLSQVMEAGLLGPICILTEVGEFLGRHLAQPESE